LKEDKNNTLEVVIVRIIYGGKKFVADDRGYLADFRGWEPAWVDYFVEESKKPDSIEYVGSLKDGNLTKTHWFVIDVFQAYYKHFGKVPMGRIVSKMTRLSLRELFNLFPFGPINSGSRLAGLPYSVDSGCGNITGDRWHEVLPQNILRKIKDKYHLKMYNG